MEGGVSCSKLLLVDVSSKEKPHAVHRVYAIMDEQSNLSLISVKLADELGASGPEEKYFLTTCSGTKETKYGQRVTDVVIQSITRVTAKLLLSSSVAISPRTNERSQHRRWRGDSHTFRRSPVRSRPSTTPLISIFSLEETPPNSLKSGSLETDLKEPPGHKGFL